MNLFAKKSIEVVLAQAADSEKGLKRTLGAWSLIALGIGVVMGAGLFVRTAAAASEAAGPGITLSFIIAALGCAFAGLCYAEFASMIPISGSAYAYSYITMGELAAWIIGWALILEYAIGATAVSIAWSEYFNKLLNGAIPFKWCHSIFEGGYLNVPAVIIVFLLTLLLIRGVRESATVNTIIVFIKVSIVLLFVGFGWHFIRPENHTPYLIPATQAGHADFFKHGWGGILGGAAIVFFAFIGFDVVSTAAQETKNPKKNMPIGIMGSLAICTILYILFGYVLTGIANYTEFATAGKEASVAYAIQHHMPGYEWLATCITVAILAGFTSVILVLLMGQSRIFYTMSNDGLIPKVFGKLHPKFKTPYKANWILFIFVGLFAAFVPGSVGGDLTSFGTLFAFTLVSIGVWVLRIKEPDLERPFRTPLVPLVPILGVIICLSMIVALDKKTLIVAFVWMILGLFVYFFYSKNHSKVQQELKDTL